MIAEALDIQKETYLAIVLDRDNDGPGKIVSLDLNVFLLLIYLFELLVVMVGSPIGGMDIEHVAETQPDKIFKVTLPSDLIRFGIRIIEISFVFQNSKEKIDSKIGITKDQALKMAKNLEFEGKNMEIVSILFA
jgi:succinyl-CoA synthetase beta subunit